MDYRFIWGHCMSGMFKQGASSFDLFSWKSSFCIRVFFKITQFNTHNHCMLPAKICAIHGDNLSFFIFSLPWHLQWTIFFHDFPGWKMKFLNSMTCANPNFNYHSSNTDHVLKTYQLLMAIHCIQKSGKVYIFTVQAHLPTTQTNWQCLFTNLKCN